MSVPTHLGQLLLHAASHRPDQAGLCAKNPSSGEWKTLSWKRVQTLVFQTAQLLEKLGIKSGDRVALWSSNSPEWFLTDLGSLCANAATVPIYLSLSPTEVEYLLNDSQSRVLFVENTELLQKLTPLLNRLNHLEAVLVFNSQAPIRFSEKRIKILSFYEALQPLSPQTEARFLQEVQKDHSDGLATLIYTSGTTGPPKGVMLTHANFLANCLAVQKAIPIYPEDVHLSFLPLCHVFERLCGHFLVLLNGAKICYAEGMDRVLDNLKETRPTILLAVPRFYEKIHEKIQSRMGRFPQYIRRLLRPLIRKKLRESLGGRVRFAVSGGAPLAQDLGKTLHEWGLPILEGYGLTETSPVITCNRLEAFRFGTVGLPVEGVEVKIAADGEILTRSACVMKGYYGRQAETTVVLEGGWFHTGDLGSLDEDGFLSITGRKKEILVTSGGKKVCPQMVEALYEKEPLITRCFLYGDGKNFLTALLLPQLELLKQLARDRQFAYTDIRQLLDAAWVHTEIERALQNVHSHLAPFEQIKYFYLLDKDFSIEEGELTPTLKPKRLMICAKYKSHLDGFYESSR